MQTPQNDYEQFLMVKLGVMEAEGGKFKPNGQLTEQEAAAIMYQVPALADPNLVESTADAQVMVDSCIAWGVMDESARTAIRPTSPSPGSLRWCAATASMTPFSSPSKGAVRFPQFAQQP